jgi:pyruvate,water dikinase
MNAWSTGSPPRGPAHWPAIVAQRRAAIAEWAKHDTPPALGPVPDVIDDPAIVMLWGITRESLDTWLNADRRLDQQRDPRFRRIEWRGRRSRAGRQVGG